MARPSECVGSHNAFHLYMTKASSSSTSSTKSSSAISGSVHFLLFSLFLFIVPNCPPLLIPETFQLYSISPLIRVTMQFDAQIALSDNILHKMTQFNRRLCRGKFGPRFLIDFFVKFGARGKKTKKFWFVASERPKLLLRRRHCPATK